MLQGQLTGLVDQYVDHRPLRGGQQHLGSTNSSCSTRPLSPPTSFIRAPGSATLNTRVLAVLVSHSRTTSPALAASCRSGSPLVNKTLPNRPMAA